MVAWFAGPNATAGWNFDCTTECFTLFADGEASIPLDLEAGFVGVPA